MKITFVNPRTDIYPPIGLCYLSSYLKSEFPDMETSLVELAFGQDRDEAIRKILASSPDIVGFTTYTVGFHEVQQFCSLLRSAAPHMTILLGGPHITSLPHSLPDSADAGVIGEGEETLAQVCHAVQKHGTLTSELLATISGLCYRDAVGKITITSPRAQVSELDSLPPPDLTILNMRWYTARRMYFTMKGNFKGFVLLTSRGCPYSCRFCQASAQWGRCRYHSAERVVYEIEQLRKTCPGINAINIIDDLFIGDRKRLREIVRLIKERNLHHGIVFNVNGHANLVNGEIIDLLKSINVIQIAYGFESGSERILDFLKKGAVTVERNRHAAELTNAAGIGVGGQFMIGCLGETEDDLRQTIRFIEETPMSHVHISVTTPMPGTELWEICRDKGFVAEDMDWRILDFGNPDNMDLIYCNGQFVTHERFLALKNEVMRVADRWNPVPSLIGNLSYWQLYSPLEFARRVLAGLNRMRLRCWNKISHICAGRSSV